MRAPRLVRRRSVFALEWLEPRALLSGFTVDLDPTLDQFGDQIVTVMSYASSAGATGLATFGIFDSGASAVTFSADDVALFDFFDSPIPVKTPGGALAGGIGGEITGDVSEPGTISADGLHASSLTFTEDGFPEFNFTLGDGASTDGIQAFLGDSVGSPDLPSITGTPLLHPTEANPEGLAALVKMTGQALDFSDVAPGLILQAPDVHFVSPSTVLTASEATTDPITVPLSFYGADNFDDPGDLITDTFLTTQALVSVAADPGNTGTPTVADHKNFLFDTGSQLTVISTRTALDLGLDLSRPETTIDVQGVGGTETVPGYTITSLTLPTSDGAQLVFTDVPVYVLDIADDVDGILGMNLLDTADGFLFNPYDPAGPQVTLTFLTNPDRGVPPDFDDGELNALVSANFLSLFAGVFTGHSVPIFGGSTIGLAGTSVSAAEDAGTVSLQVARSGNLSTTQTVHFATADGTAKAGVNYTDSSGDLTFGPGETTKTINIPLLDDGAITPDLGFTLTLSSPHGGASLSTAASASVTVRNTDSPGTIALENAAYSVVESGGQLVVNVVRTGGNLGGVTVHYATADGTARAGVNYVAAAGTLTFGPGETSQPIVVSLRDDTLITGDLGFRVTLTDPTGGVTLGTPASADVTVGNTDVGGSVQFEAESYAFDERAGTLSVLVRRLSGSAAGASVHYTAIDGTAKAGVNFASTSGDLTFAANESGKILTVPMLVDDLVTADLHFSLALSDPGAGVILGSPDSVDVVIHNTDVAGSVQFEAATYTVDEGTGKVALKVTRTGGTARGVTVHYATADGSAKHDINYSTVSGDLTFETAETEKSLIVPILADHLVTGELALSLTLSAPGGGATLGAQEAASLAIRNTDVAGSVQFDAANYAVDEAAGKATIKVTRTEGTAGGVTVHYAASDGGAMAGTNYTPTAGELTFNADDTAKTFDVPILGDDLVTGNLSLRLTLTAPGGGAVLGTPAASVLTIRDGDSAGSIGFDDAAYSVDETAGEAILKVVRTGGSAGGVSVRYATADAGAIAGVNYTAASGTLAFGANETSKTIRVPIKADGLATGDLRLTVTLSAAAGGAALGVPSSVPLTIHNTDPGGSVQFEAGPYSVEEGVARAILKVVRTGGTAGGVTVRYASIEGTAKAGANFSPVSGTLEFAAGETNKTIEVPILDDRLVTPDLGLAVRLSAPSPGTALGANESAGVRILNTDRAGEVGFETDAVTLNENAGNAVLTVRRTGGDAGGVSVAYSTIGDTALAGTNFRAVTGILNFGVGETTKTVEVPLIQDGRPGAERRFRVVLSEPGGGVVVGRSQTSVAVQNVDPPFAGALTRITTVELIARGGRLRQVLVSFSGAIKATTVRASNFRLAVIDPGTGAEVQTITGIKAQYSKPRRQVRLTLPSRGGPASGLVFRLTATGILNASGTPLDGDSDQWPGGDLSARLSAQLTSFGRAVAAVAVDRPAVTHDLAGLGRKSKP